LLLPVRVQVQMTRVLREALSNVILHSGGYHCRVCIGWAAGELSLSVEDDGRGMDPAALPATGNGLGGMERRVRILAGRQTWQRSPLGGVRLQVQVPLNPDASGGVATSTPSRP
jgi:signal transduction histidine kinase